MAGLKGCRAAACLLAGGLACHLSRSHISAFTAPRVNVQLPSQAVGTPVVAGARISVQQPDSSVSSICGIFAAAVAVERVSRIAMRSQGQGGKHILGQSWMPTAKGAKHRHITRPRKQYGSGGARKVPRRYPLYDILEETCKKLPTYTVVWEPEEPMRPVEDVPLLERYPWANSLEKVPKAKQEKESGPDKMERYFGSIVYENLPPIGRQQLYVHRRGWALQRHPPWLNTPLVGTAPKVPKDMEWKKDRRPEPWQFEGKPKMIEFMTKNNLWPKTATKEDAALMTTGDDIDDALEGLEDKAI